MPECQEYQKEKSDMNTPCENCGQEFPREVRDQEPSSRTVSPDAQHRGMYPGWTF